MLATKAGAESNKPSTMRHDGIMRTREGQTHKLESRELGRGDRQNLAALQAIANTNAMLSSMLNAAQRNKVDKLMLKKKKTPHSKRMHGVLRTSPRRSHPERLQ